MTNATLRNCFTPSQRALIWNALQEKMTGDRQAAAMINNDPASTEALKSLAATLRAQADEADALSDIFE